MEHLIELYNQSAEKNCDYQIKQQLFLRHWLTQITEFDVTTYLPLYTNLLEISQLEVPNHRKIYEQDIDDIFSYPLEDAISTLIKQVQPYVELLLPDLNTKIIRQHEIMPVQNAREFDQTSLQWLSRQSGRTVREKLATSQKMMAVKRQISFDTIENKLVKRFLQDLLQILDVKRSIKNIQTIQEEQDFYENIESWLYSDVAKSIGNWENYTPNNVLLQHKYYKKIWSSWRELNWIDDLIIQDKDNIIYNGFQVLYYNLMLKLLSFNEIRIDNKLLKINYKDFLISPVHQESKSIGWVVRNGENLSKFCVIYNRDEFIFELQDLIGNKEIKIRLIKSDSGYSIKYKTNQDWIDYPETIDSIQKIQSEILSCFNIYKISKKNQLITQVKDKKIGLDLTNIYINYSFKNKVKKLKVNNFIQIISQENSWLASYNLLNRTFRLDEKHGIYDFYQALKIKDHKKQDVIFQNMMEYFKKNFQCECLNYIIPDEFNDFQLTILRKNIQVNFLKSNAIPKSIATVFTLQSEGIEIKENDIFFVIDMNYNTLTWTKLRANYDSEIAKIIPETQGIVWERFPTEKLEIELTLVNDDNNFIEYISQSLDIRKLPELNLSFINDKNIIHSENIFNQIDGLLSNLNKNKIKSLLNQLKGQYKKLKVVAPSIIKNEFLKEYSHVFVNLDKEILLGELYLSECQKRLYNEDKNLVSRLWQDHLPKMSIEVLDNGVYKKIHLVEDQLIIPKRNARIEIPVSAKILLSKETKQFNFPLYLGENAEDFEAILQSSSFPLKDQEECNLQMYYTYGADQPYELYFIRNNGNKLKVDWKQIKAKENLPIPSYPQILSWQELENFNNRFNKSENIIEGLKNIFQEIIDFQKYLNQKVIRTKGIVLFKNLKTKDSLKVKFGNEEVWCHKNNFFEMKDFSLIKDGDDVYAELNKKDRYFVYDITFSKELPLQLEEKYEDKKKNFIEYRYKKNIKSKFYQIYTVFNNARSLDGNEYQLLMSCFISIQNLINNSSLNEYIPNCNADFYLLMACTHAMAPQFYIDKLIKDIDDKFTKSTGNIGYALGDLSQDWQKKLFVKVLAYTDKSGINLSSSVEVLGISLWRDKNIVFKLSDQQAKNILKKLPNLLDQDIKDYQSKRKPHILVRTLRHFECLLALLRLRERESFKGYLLNTQPEIKACDIRVNEMIQLVVEDRIEIKTNILLNVKKTEGSEHIPDFLYALRLYLTGNDGANAISISYNNE